MHPSIRISHAEPADADRWLDLRAALWPGEDRAALAAEVTRFFTEARVLGSMPEAVLVAVDTGGDPGLLGFAEVSRRLYAEGCATSPVGFLEGWYVAPAHRRRGVGRALVTGAESWARALGCREFASDALADNALSAVAHHRLGFDEVEVLRCFRKSLVPDLE